jgi:hypothetical protein
MAGVEGAGVRVVTKLCLILAMLRQPGEVHSAKNMKFREMVNTADYQVC